jgi:choloylglycine hydrolase
MCTALMVSDTHGVAYSGKTMEYSGPLPMEMTYMPAGTRIVSVAPDGADGASFITKHAILGGAMPASYLPGAHQCAMIEAANDKGLSISTNQLNNSRTPDDVGSDRTKQLASSDFATWLLGGFASVKEAKAALVGGAIKIWLPKIPFSGNVPMPEHYILFDKAGDGIVIEFLGGSMQVHDNPVGVATNGPSFSWHLENLNNYAFLSNLDRNDGQFGKLKVRAEDCGNALSGLPSTQISSGRFVKAAYYTTYVRKAKTPEEAVVTLAHILNNFDRPYNLAEDPPGAGGDGPAMSEVSTETTTFTWMNDKARNRYYLRTIDQMNFATFEIDKLAGVKTLITVPFSQVTDSTLDGTALMLKAAGA